MSESQEPTNTPAPYEIEVGGQFPTRVRIFSRGNRRFLSLKSWGESVGCVKELTPEDVDQLAKAIGVKK